MSVHSNIALIATGAAEVVAVVVVAVVVVVVIVVIVSFSASFVVSFGYVEDSIGKQ